MPDDILARLRQLHHNAPKMRCGARVVKEVTHYSGQTYENQLVCTLAPGHDDLHKDEICCWRFHTFTEGTPAPEDVWGGRCCSCGLLECRTRAILEGVG